MWTTSPNTPAAPGPKLAQALQACDNVDTRSAISRHLQSDQSIQDELQGPIRTNTRLHRVATAWGTPITEHTDTNWPIAETIQNGKVQRKPQLRVYRG